MNIYPPYILKHHSNYVTKIITLIISQGEGWHYLVVKRLSALFRETTSKNNGFLSLELSRFV